MIISIPHSFATDRRLRAGVRFQRLPFRWRRAASDDNEK
jgi:hypothetical protein